MKKKSSTLEQLAEMQKTVIGTERAKTRKILSPKAGPAASGATTEPEPESAPVTEAPSPAPAELATANDPAPATPLPVTATTEPATASLPLSAQARQKLEKHCANGRWTTEGILEELIRAHLHGAYPAVTYRTMPLADAGVFCSFDRVTCAPHLLFKTGRGRYLIQARPENPEHVKWLATYQKRHDPRAHEKASEMCVFSLQQRLERYDGPGTTHVIFPEDFLVEHVA
jgi:hypothetical protein